jgi:phosphoglycerate kinase
MGIYEIPQFSEGTKTIARIIANLHGTTIIGGGSTSEIVTELKLCDKMTFVSTGRRFFENLKRRNTSRRRSIA